MSSLVNVLHPARYHGFNTRPPFFEGWYFKLVSADGNQRFAIIPGVYKAAEEGKSHCFVQVFNSQADKVTYHRYPFDAFTASPDRFEVWVGPNFFSAEKVVLDINDDLAKVTGQLEFRGLHPWPVKFISPGAMGWFAWVPFMECYHGVVSIDHAIKGGIQYNGAKLNFSGGRGFIEKDWGRQFPSAWIWSQSNHFDRQGISLMLSIAEIPWLGRSFGGFIVGLLFEGVIHRFATYNGGVIESLELDDENVQIVVRNRTHRLHITATRAEGGLLQAPTLVEMDRRILETMDATLKIDFETLSRESIYMGVGKYAGLETVGDMTHLISKVLRP
jgi:tocopherol cyclase